MLAWLPKHGSKFAAEKSIRIWEQNYGLTSACCGMATMITNQNQFDTQKRVTNEHLVWMMSFSDQTISAHMKIGLWKKFPKLLMQSLRVG